MLQRKLAVAVTAFNLLADHKSSSRHPDCSVALVSVRIQAGTQTGAKVYIHFCVFDPCVQVQGFKLVVLP